MHFICLENMSGSIEIIEVDFRNFGYFYNNRQKLPPRYPSSKLGVHSFPLYPFSLHRLILTYQSDQTWQI